MRLYNKKQRIAEMIEKAAQPAKWQLQRQMVRDLMAEGMKAAAIAEQTGLGRRAVELYLKQLETEAVIALLDTPGMMEARLKSWLLGEFDIAENLQKQLQDPELIKKDAYAIKAVADASEQVGNRILKAMAIFAANGGNLEGRQNPVGYLDAGDGAGSPKPESSGDRDGLADVANVGRAKDVQRGL